MAVCLLRHFKRYLGAVQSWYEHHLIQYLPWCVVGKLISKQKRPFSQLQRPPCEDHGPIPSLSCHMAHPDALPRPLATIQHPAGTTCLTNPSQPWTRVPLAGAIAAGKTQLQQCQGQGLVPSRNLPLCQALSRPLLSPDVKIWQYRSCRQPS